MERRFQTKDELEHFDFEDAVLEEVECACGRVKVMIDNVAISLLRRCISSLM